MGFNYLGPVDGHNIQALESLFNIAKSYQRPTLVHVITTKGKGVSFMENSVEWHGKAINDEEYKKAIEELTANKIDFTE